MKNTKVLQGFWDIFLIFDTQNTPKTLLIIDILIFFYIWIFSKIVYILNMEKILALDLKNEESILKISKALANPGRLDIFKTSFC